MQLKRINSAIDRVGRNDINENFDKLEHGYGKAFQDAELAKEQSTYAKEKAESVQAQFNQVVIEGDSSVEAAQARVSLDDTVYDTLKERLDTEKEQVIQQLSETEKKVKWISFENFGALGAPNDDYEALQRAFDFAYEYDIFDIRGANKEYLTSYPLVMKTKKTTSDSWWSGKGTKLRGLDLSTTKITKTTSNVLSDVHSEVNGIDSTIILFNQERDGVENNGGESTGISIKNISIENRSTSTDAMAITGQACNRMTIEDVNIKSRKGIVFNRSYSNRFKNILFQCEEDALKILVGTSNTFEFLYAPACHNPYTLLSAYSTMNSVCADDATGIVFNVNGNGLVMNGCGCESPKAQYIVNCYYQGRNINTANITSLYFMRQTGDAENGLLIENCAVFKSLGHIKVGSLNIVDHAEISGNSYLLEAYDTSLDMSLDIGLITYYKNYTGGNTNPKLIYSKVKANGNSAGKVEVKGVSINTRRNFFMPYIGSRRIADSLNTTMNNKAIYLDVKDKTHTEDGTDIGYEQKYNKGDLLLINDPKAMNMLGYTVTGDSAGEYVLNNTVSEIPINLVGTTAQRPTQNLYVGLEYKDTTLQKPIIWWGSSWKDYSGTVV